MGQSSKQLYRTLKKMSGEPWLTVEVPQGGREKPTVENFIGKGHDPLHAEYILAQHIASEFFEQVAELPAMRKYVNLYGKAEDLYLPTGPPMSPLTGSYFACWSLFDFQFDGDDTLGSCLIAANDFIRLEAERFDALKKMAASRMGIYEHLGAADERSGKVRLHELITGDEVTCHCTSGYQGEKGQLWYIRLLPPLAHQNADYHISFTTPYILTHCSKSDWTEYLERTLTQFPGGDQKDSLHKLMKHGPDTNYWNEFIFLAYLNFQTDAVFLTGIPDRKETLPHA